MTRFARASGSKASNQKVPEESTPWYLMKQQVLQGKKDPGQNKEKEVDWKTVIDAEREVEKNKNSVWCPFEVETTKTKVKPVVVNSPTEESKPHSFGNKRKSIEGIGSNINSSIIKKRNKVKLISKSDATSLANSNSETKVKQSNLKHIKAKLKLPKSKPLFEVEVVSEAKNNVDINRSTSKTSALVEDFVDSTLKFGSDDCVNGTSSDCELKLNSFQQKNKLFYSSNMNNFTSCENQKAYLENYDESGENEILKTKQCKDDSSRTDFFINDEEKPINNNSCGKRNNTLTWKQWNKKERSSQPYKRRKVDEGDVKLEINGEEIWVTKLDGFYIKKEDARRIKQLEKDLFKKGVSRQEVRAVVKKERRNAEKALARQKKKVCFHCRKGGHTLSSCPKLEASGAQVFGSGICYKCGSTEHTHYQCKVTSGQSYKFATCFVCKQEGHISRQCPENPRGMYPSGGGCRLCGDVTHFRRECPTLQTKANKVTVGLIDQNVETFGDQSEKSEMSISKESLKRKNKIIKFS